MYPVAGAGFDLRLLDEQGSAVQNVGVATHSISCHPHDTVAQNVFADQWVWPCPEEGFHLDTSQWAREASPPCPARRPRLRNMKIDRSLGLTLASESEGTHCMSMPSLNPEGQKLFIHDALASQPVDSSWTSSDANAECWQDWQLPVNTSYMLQVQHQHWQPQLWPAQAHQHACTNGNDPHPKVECTEVESLSVDGRRTATPLARGTSPRLQNERLGGSDVEMEDTCTYERAMMLRYRNLEHAQDGRVSSHMLCKASWPSSVPSSLPFKRKKQTVPVQRAVQQALSAPRLAPSKDGYKVTKAVFSHKQEVERSVRNLLNIAAPENFDRIVQRFREIDLSTAEELHLLVWLIFKKALMDPHHVETYARLVYSLENGFPEFPTDGGGPPTTLLRALVEATQVEFETLLITTDSEELSAKERSKLRDRGVANMKFIGQLFLWQMLPLKVIQLAVVELLAGTPEEHMVECACELLKAVGHTMDGTTKGHTFMSQALSRMNDLAHSTGYTKRMLFTIKNLEELRSGGWKQKLLREKATTLDVVREAAAAEAKSVSRGGRVEFATHTTGALPASIDELLGSRARRARTQETKSGREELIRLVSYFMEDWDAAAFVKEWQLLWPSSSAAREATAWLVELGFQSADGGHSQAELLVELVSRGAIAAHVLGNVLTQFFKNLDDVILDEPWAPSFLQLLFAKLITASHETSSRIVSQLPQGGDCKWCESVLLGALRLVGTPHRMSTHSAVDQAELYAAISGVCGFVVTRVE